jgi:hypothetical protein
LENGDVIMGVFIDKEGMDASGINTEESPTVEGNFMG